MSARNRKAYILTASADFAVCDGRWRSYCRDAFLTHEDAEAAKPGYLERCRAADDEILGPDPDTISVRVVRLDFEDDDEARDGRIYMLAAEGREAAFGLGGRIPFLCGTLFSSRSRAEAEMPAFLDRCADPALGNAYSLRKDLKGSIGELALRGMDAEDEPQAARSP